VEAMTLANRIVLLTPGGRIGQFGRPLELYTRPQNEFVAQFIGSPAMNLLPGEVVGTGDQTTIKLDAGGVAVSAVPTRSSEEGLKVNVGLRPEDLVETDGDCIFEGKVIGSKRSGKKFCKLFKERKKWLYNYQLRNKYENSPMKWVWI